jgi:hypothetical protein
LRRKFISSCDVSCSNLRGTGVGFSAGFIEVGKDRGGGVQPSSDANFWRVPKETPDDLNDAHFFSHSPD